MNIISHKKLVIEFDTWEPFKKISEEEIDVLIGKVKSRELLGHCGNIHLRLADEGDAS